LAGTIAIGAKPGRLDATDSTGGTGIIMKPKKELELVWDMLDRAMSVIDELTNQRPPHPRLENEIEEIQEEMFNIRGEIE
jgi:hypothetical protein